MPSTSAKQAKFMRAVANSPSFAKKVGVKQAVGKDFEMADKKKMRKFSAGGAQGKYDRRMADIKKDFEKDSAGKSGRALEVLAAKRAQRTADAEDDRAKRMGTDRTATRKAEYDAEKNLSRTRRFGADKPAAPAEPVKASTPEPVKASEPEKAKPKTFGEAFKAARRDLGAGKTFTYNGKSFTTNIAGEGRKPALRTNNSASTVGSSTNSSAGTPAAVKNNPPAGAPKGDSTVAILQATKAAPAPKRYETPAQAAARVAKLTGSAERRNNLAGAFGIDSVSNAKARASLLATREKEKARNAERSKGSTPLASGTDTKAFFTFGDAAAKKNAANKAKGGKIMKYAKGGSTPPQPTAAERKSDAKFRESIKTIKVTPEQGNILNKTGKKMAKGGKMASCGMKKGGKAKAKSFAATKFGAAMMKKSADTKGRAMPKFAKGGSIDGCAVKGKTKTSMIKMKNGGSC